MAVHSDVERFGRALDLRRSASITGADAQLLDDLFTDDVVWHGAPGASGGQANGKADVVSRWNALATGSNSRSSVFKVYADGDHTVAILEHSPGGGGGQPVRQAVIFEMNENGKATQFWGLPSDAELERSFASGTPVPEHRHLKRFRTAEAARERWTFEPEDVAAIEAFLREDVIWQGAGNSQWKQGVESRPEVFRWYKLFKQVTNNTMNMAIHETYAGDRYAVSFVTISADRPDHPEKHLNMPEVNLFHLDDEGRCFEYWGIADDQAVMDDFWAP